MPLGANILCVCACGAVPEHEVWVFDVETGRLLLQRLGESRRFRFRFRRLQSSQAALAKEAAFWREMELLDGAHQDGCLVSIGFAFG